MAKRTRKHKLGSDSATPPAQPDAAAEPAAAEPEPPGKNPAAVQLGRLGGLKGGHARARRLTKEQRVLIARKAAQARWARERRP